MFNVTQRSISRAKESHWYWYRTGTYRCAVVWRYASCGALDCVVGHCSPKAFGTCLLWPGLFLSAGTKERLKEDVTISSMWSSSKTDIVVYNLRDHLLSTSFDTSLAECTLSYTVEISCHVFFLSLFIILSIISYCIYLTDHQLILLFTKER